MGIASVRGRLPQGGSTKLNGLAKVVEEIPCCRRAPLSTPGWLQAFWSVVCSELSSEERRLLLLFITGTDRLPEAGCETLSIEVRGNKALRLRLGGEFWISPPPENNRHYPHNSATGFGRVN